MRHLLLGAQRINSDVDGFSRLTHLHSQLRQIENEQLSLSFSGLRWLDGHLVAPLSIILKLATARGNKIEITNVHPVVERTLSRNKFRPIGVEDGRNTAMPLTHFGLKKGVDFSLYAKKHLDRPEVPRMTEALKGKFFEGIDELFANSALHSQAPIDISVCGQFFPHDDRIDFALADGGRSIPGSLAASRVPYTNDLDAVEWAMTPGHTTRQLDIPGGLGLKVLRDFIRLNNGRLLMISGAAYWCQAGDAITKVLMRSAFPGTAVVLELNTADKNQYDLVNPPSPLNIW